VNTTPLQLELAHTKLGVPQHKLHHLHQPVDDLFWRPLDGLDRDPVLCSVGWEARDFATLTSAVNGIAAEVRLAVGVAALASGSTLHAGGKETSSASVRSPSPFEGLKGTFTYDLYQQWIDQIARDGLPPNVEMREQVDPENLRDLYRRSRFVVVPLHDVEFDAGITAVTEAMAMGKAVIVSQTRGQAGVISHGGQGFFVRPHDPRALRQAIEYLLDRPQEAERMGHAGRQLVEERHRLDDFVKQLAQIVRQASDN